MSIKKLALILAALAMVVVVVGCGSSDKSKSSPKKEQPNQEQASKKTPKKPKQQLAPKKGTEEKGTEEKGTEEKEKPQEVAPRVPEKRLLRLTIPKMENLKRAPIPTGLGTDEYMFKNNTAVHVAGTGFPWEDEANVYIAGHVEGYEGTPSYKAFEGIKTLEDGDKIYVSDANDRLYTYEVYEKEIVPPTEVDALKPVPGKNILTLQTCEIVNVDANGNPDYENTERYLVRAERVS